MNTTAVVRKRAQPTIPDKIPGLTKKIDWKKVWEGIALARSLKGKRGNLSKFIIEDRRGHNG